ncbi:replication protein RepA [Azospirillum sp. ST 5-10]|uniref:replication protein RepA n=1 Tax=unclassified Azospirillum TaxID=2630922 RepID=UPI003F4A3A68
MGQIHDLIREHGVEAARTMAADADRPLVDLAAEALTFDRREIAYLYSGLAQTPLPHRRPADAAVVWRCRQGPYSLSVEPSPGSPPSAGVPYGSRGRLMLLYLQTEAMRTGSPEVRLGHSLRDWMRRMGVASGGSSYAAVRDQAERLAACVLRVGWAPAAAGDPRPAGVVDVPLLAPCAGRRGAWGETVRLSDAFFETLRRHPLPVSARAVRAVQNSSAVIDAYVWLCHRLGTVSKPVDEPWAGLHRQFGAEYREIRQFRAKFAAALREALAVYPGANVEIRGDGVRLLPSSPAVGVRRLLVVGHPVGAARWPGL